MSMTKTLTKFPYYIAEGMRKQLENSKRAIMEGDQDRIIVIDGNEGSGKSTIARQLAYYVDNEFSIDDVCFSSKQFAERIVKKKKFGAIIFDEAFRGLSSRGTLSKENKKLVQLLQECRQRNLFVFIVLPSIFLLEKYVALFRSHALIHTAVYKKDFKKRYYKIYNRQNKKMLYLLGQKYMSYSRPKIHLLNRFYAKFPPTISKEEYDEKKFEAFREESKEKEKINRCEEIARIQRNIIITKIHDDYNIKYIEISKWLENKGYPMHSQSLGKLRYEIPEKPKHLASLQNPLPYTKV